MPATVATLGELAQRFGLTCRGDSEQTITGVGTLASAGAGQIAFLANPLYRKQLGTTQAAAVVLTENDAGQCPVACLIVRVPYVAFAKIAALFEPKPERIAGAHPSAVVAADARIDPTASIGAQTYIGARSIIEAGALIGPGCVIGEDCVIGANSELVARVTLVTRVRLGRNVRIQADLVDQLFNSAEKRLARVLLLLARFGKEGKPEPLIAKVSQETLADMIGTTRSRVSFFMNKFRKLGFIQYNGGLRIHSSLLNVVLHD